MWKGWRYRLYRFGVFAVTIGACAWMARALGAVPAIAIWAAFEAVFCGLIAVLMQRVPLGKISVAGRLAAIFLPFGYRLSRGRLLPMVMISWAAWVLLGSASAIVTATRFDPRPLSADGHARGTLPLVLLLLAWLADGVLLLILLRTITRWGAPSSAARPVLLMMGGIFTTIAGSAMLWWMGRYTLAVLLASGPPVGVGGFYTVFLIVLATNRGK